MSESSNIVFDKSNESIRIKDLVILNSDVYDFLHDKKNQEDWITKALIIGCIGLKQMVIKDNVDFVEKEFNKFIDKTQKLFEKNTKSIDERIEDTFSIEKRDSPISLFIERLDSTFDPENGAFSKVIQEYFDKDNGQIKSLIDKTFDLDNKKSALSLLLEDIKENTDLEENKIKELLDPNKTDSPARQLKEAIFGELKEIKERDLKEISDKIKDLKDKEIKEIHDKILQTEATEKEREKGTAKGLDFEEEVLDELEQIARDYEDTITETGKINASFGKKGDILVEVNGNNKKKIVIECKNSTYNSCKKVNDEITDAMKNRKASYGIFLFAKREQMPNQYCPIKITNSYIITYMSQENLHLSYKLLRTLLLKENNNSAEAIDFEKISKELNDIENFIKNIDDMQRRVTSIATSCTYLQSNLHSLHRNIDNSIEKIKSLLGEKIDSTESNEIERIKKGVVGNY